MTTLVARRQSSHVARPLIELMPLIKEQLELANSAAEPFWLEAGKLLLEAKSQLSGREFGPWAALHFGIGDPSLGLGMKSISTFLLGFVAASTPVLVYIAWVAWRIG
jgi:hypothetical protein